MLTQLVDELYVENHCVKTFLNFPPHFTCLISWLTFSPSLTLEHGVHGTLYLAYHITYHRIV